MWKRSKKMVIILMLFILTSLVVSFAWFHLENIIFQNNNESFGNYLLFLFGYSDLQNVNSLIQVIITFISITGISFFTSILTVSIFESRKKLKIEKNIIVCRKDSQYSGNENVGIFLIHNQLNDIYKLNISLQLINSRTSLCHEYTIPYVSKGESYLVQSNLDAGSIIYTHLQDKMEHKDPSAIILTAEYIDSRYMQTFIFCQKYEFGNYIMDGSDLGLGGEAILKIDAKKYDSLSSLSNDTQYDDVIKKMILNPVYKINLQLAKQINNVTIEDDYTKKKHAAGENPENDYLYADVHFTTKKTDSPDIFAMAMLDKPLGGNWLKYYDIGCFLSFSINVSKGIELRLEIKGLSGPPFYEWKMIGQGTWVTCEVELSQCPRENWSFVRELCFTVFQKECETNKGRFVVKNCKLIRQSHKKGTAKLASPMEI